jgi:UDP-N-acetyl-3-dehydro-alpha-D-glucosamine 3-aminotranferase
MIGAEIEAAVLDVLRGGAYILGPNVRALEQELAAFVGAAHAVGVASGTDALRLGVHALGLKPGDEVITTPFTFVASANTISRAGATPVFVDIRPDTFTIDPQHVEAAITSRTVGIVPVHLYGQAADLDALMAIAERHNLWVLEDCAQAIGATWNGRAVGTFGAAGCISFYPSKNLGAAGDAGMIVTNSPRFAEQITLLRRHGGKDKYHVEVIGYNSRLDELQAAVLRVKLRRLGEWNAARQGIAAHYDALLVDTPVTPPLVDRRATHVYHQYTIRAPRRAELVEYLRRVGIGTMIYYPYPLHRQPVYAELGYTTGSLPESERAGNEVLSLPIYPELTEAQVATVGAAITAFYDTSAWL